MALRLPRPAVSRLGIKLFLIILLGNVVIAGLVFLAVSRSLDRGFIEYLETTQANRAERLAEAHDGVRLLRAPQVDGGDGRPSRSAPNGAPTQRRVQETQERQAGRLGLLAAGAEVPRPALLLQEDPVRALLQALDDEWDVVLFDTPPALLYDDAFRLAALSDLVLLLAAACETRRGAFDDVRSRLDTVCPNSVAALLNRYRPSPGSAYGYGTYAYTSYPTTDERPDPWTRRVSRGVRRIVKG